MYLLVFMIFAAKQDSALTEQGAAIRNRLFAQHQVKIIEKEDEIVFADKKRILLQEIKSFAESNERYEQMRRAYPARKLAVQQDISNLADEKKKYENWIQELVRYTNEKTSKTSKVFWLGGRGDYRVDFSGKRKINFAQTEQKEKNAVDLDDDLLQVTEDETARSEGDSQNKLSCVEISSKDQLQAISAKVEHALAAKDLASIKKDFDRLKGLVEEGREKLLQEVGLLTDLCGEKIELENAVQKLKWAETSLIDKYQNLLTESRTRTHFAQKWKSSCLEVMKALDLFLTPQSRVEEALTPFIGLSDMVKVRKQGRALSEGGGRSGLSVDFSVGSWAGTV